MKDVIKEILEMDKRGRSLKEEAQKEKILSEQSIERERQKIHDEYIERAQEKIKKSTELEQKRTQIKLDEIEEKRTTTLKFLDEQYAANKDKWISEIVQSVIDNWN